MNPYDEKKNRHTTGFRRCECDDGACVDAAFLLTSER
jgi:hypothetical protein